MRFKVILAFLVLFSPGCAWTRIGDLTIISTRNIESTTDYQLIQRYVEGKGKKKKGVDPLDQAINKAVKSIEGGEFLKNIKIYVKHNGQKVKIEGDVWGLPPAPGPGSK